MANSDGYMGKKSMTKYYRSFINLCYAKNIAYMRNLLILKIAQTSNKTRLIRIINFWRIFRTIENRLGYRVHSSTVASQLQKLTGWNWSICLKIACIGG